MGRTNESEDKLMKRTGQICVESSVAVSQNLDPPPDHGGLMVLTHCQMVFSIESCFPCPNNLMLSTVGMSRRTIPGRGGKGKHMILEEKGKHDH